MMEIRRTGHSRVREPASRQRAGGVDGVAESGTAVGRQNAIAIVGLACRYPDAGDVAAFFQVIVGRRRAFRRIPPCRIDSADKHRSDPGAPDAAHGTRAALIEGWRFDRAAFGISQPSYLSADPSHWLAMETTARALAGAGFPGGAGLPGERTGVYVGAVPLASARPGTIAAAICGQFRFGGGGFSIDAGAVSSLSAVASACSALAAGELDAAIAGGVDVSLEPLELAGLARAETLAVGDMRIYDKNPTGFLPGEGCGMVLLMRTADATAAGLPVYAEILGYGMASASQHRRHDADPSGMLSALRRAYETAAIDPADVQLIEGCGTGIGHADEAELTALATLRSGARRPASIGAVTANIGNTGAAAGAAGLIKAVLATVNGVLPPTVGVATPHPILSDAKAGLRLLAAPEPWPAGDRHAGVSARSLDGLTAHIVLRGQPGAKPTLSGHCAARAAAVRADGQQRTAFLVHAPDRAALKGVLSRIAERARWLSDAQLYDLACQLAIEAADQGRVKVAIVASRQEQLARLAGEAITMLPGLTGKVVSARHGIFAADDADGKVSVLLADHRSAPAESSQQQLERMLAVLARLDELGVKPTAAVGHGLGELAALVCAGSISAAHARALNYLRTDALTASTTAAPGNLSSAIDGFAGFGFGMPLCRLVSGCTGTELATPDDIGSSLTAELLDARSAAEHNVSAIPAGQRLAAAVRAGAGGAALLLQSGRDRDLTRAVGQLDPATPGAGRRRKIPVVSVDGNPADDRCMARAAAALFAAGALTKANVLYAGHQARPIDIWREPVFISRPSPSPSQSPSPSPTPARPTQTPARPTPTPVATKGTPPHPPTAKPGAPEPEVTGVASWYRCYAEQTIEPAGSMAASADGPWRVYTGGCDALRNELAELFEHEPAAGRTLAVLGRPNDGGAVEAALLAAQDAIGTGQLLAVSPHPGWSGLWATLRAEHQATGITTVRTELDQARLRAAGRIGTAPGEYRELTIGADEGVRELVMVPAAIERSGSFPLAEGDVVLISRSAGAAGQALAQVLACCGAAVAFVGRDHPGRDDAVIAALEQLRQAGARITYEIVNPSSAAALDGAVRRIERRLGPVTAVAHAVRPTPPRSVASLRPADLATHVSSEARLLERLVKAARGRDHALRFIVTFGSVTGRYGLGDGAMAALAAGLVADQGERLAAASPGCRALHVDWPAAMPVADGSRLMLSMLGAAAELPGRLAVHGRVGLQAPRPVALGSPSDPALAGRFIERVLVHYPGVELVAEAAIDTRSDPYLNDYMVDGASLLPPTMAIEAMAQAASALAGAPTRSATDVLMAAPIVLSKQQPAPVLRICALRNGNSVTTAVRCDVTAFTVDHFSATFEPTAVDPGMTKASSKQVLSVVRGDLERATIGPAEIYQSLCFQTGRFRRLKAMRLAGAHSASASVSGHDTQPWFRQREGIDRRQDLVLGSAAVSDAAMQLVQCCVPHRKLSFVSCERAEFSPTPDEELTIRVTEVKTAIADLVPAPRTGDQTTAVDANTVTCWNVEGIDSSGLEVLRLHGLRMRDAGALTGIRPWPAPLLACLLEQVAAGCGLGPDLKVTVGKGGNGHLGGSWLGAAADTRIAGLDLHVRANGPVGCAWRTDRPAIKGPAADRLQPWLAVVNSSQLGVAEADCAQALASVIASSMNTATPPPDLTADVQRVATSNWLVLQADAVRVIATLVDLKSARRPVAIALRTGAPATAIEHASLIAARHA